MACLQDGMVINFDGHDIPVRRQVKKIGIHFDRYMLFDTHIHKLTKKVTSILIFVNRVQDMLDKKTRTIIVEALVLSLINYGLKIWGNTNITLMNKAQ